VEHVTVAIWLIAVAYLLFMDYYLQRAVNPHI